ncbi:MAG: PhnD/SsuA/transferrin family substrate-binding protein [Elusimicrobiaceae bacterium]
MPVKFKPLSAWRVALIVIASVSLTAAVGCSKRREASVGTPSNPLMVVLSPAHAPATPEILPVFKRLIEEKSGMAIDITIASSPFAAIEMFGINEADAGLLTLEEYLIAKEEYKTHAELQAVRESSSTSYESVILVRTGSPVKTITDLTGKKVAFSDAYSLSGFMLPAIYLDKAGIAVSPEFSGGHEASAAMLARGETDAAATYARMAQRYPGLQVLACAGVLPNEPFVTRAGLLPEKRKAITDAVAALSSSMEGKRALASVADITGFQQVSGDIYRPVHELIRSARKSVYDLIPDGWNIRRLNEPYYPD